jgi:hypothetical protein
LKSNVVPDFIALHEGSIKGEKTQPTIELYPQDKYEWFGDVTSIMSLSICDDQMLMRTTQGKTIIIHLAAVLRPEQATSASISGSESTLHNAHNPG